MTKLKSEIELPINIGNQILETIKKAKNDVDEKMQQIENNNPEYSNSVKFDIGLKTAFLEVEPAEEIKQFYQMENPSPEALLIAKIIVGSLNKWDLINESDSSATWENIKDFFLEEMDDRVGEYFLMKIKEDQIDLSSENIFKLKLLVKGKSFSEEGPEGCDLLKLLYTALVDPLMRAIGHIDEGIPYFVWSELSYESIMLQIGIDNLTTDIES